VWRRLCRVLLFVERLDNEKGHHDQHERWHILGDDKQDGIFVVSQQRRNAGGTLQ